MRNSACVTPHSHDRSSERTRRRYASHLRKRIIIIIITIIIVADDDRSVNTSIVPLIDSLDSTTIRRIGRRLCDSGKRVASRNPDNPGDINA